MKQILSDRQVVMFGVVGIICGCIFLIYGNLFM